MEKGIGEGEKGIGEGRGEEGIMVRENDERSVSEEKGMKLRFGRTEYLNRRNWSVFEELEDEDKEVFAVIDQEIAEIEDTQKRTYVYLKVGTYRKIELGAKMGMSDSAIMSYIGVSYSKWKKLLKKYPLLRERIDMWKRYVVAKASENLAKSVVEKGNVEDSKWVLERLDREQYGRKSEVSVGGEVVHKHKVDVEQLKELRADMGKAFLTDKDEVGGEDNEECVVDI